jgi:hypothetical protein
MKVTVYWSEITHYNADIEVPDGMSDEAIENYIHEDFTNLCWRVSKDIGGQIEHDSIEWHEIGE